MTAVLETRASNYRSKYQMTIKNPSHFIDTFQFNRKFQFPCFFLFLTKIGELISRTIFINFFSRRFINIFLIFKFSLTKYSLYYSLLYKDCKCLQSDYILECLYIYIKFIYKNLGNSYDVLKIFKITNKFLQCLY